MSLAIENDNNPGKSATILVVDDDVVTRKTLVKVLNKSGVNTLQAENGKEALAIFNLERPDIVLLDVMMPEMDGYAACRELRKLADARTLPILMLTGLDDISAVDEAFDAGATDFITKPINWSLLNQRVRYALRTQETYQQLHRNQRQLSQAQRIAGLGYYEITSDNRINNCSDELTRITGPDCLKNLNLATYFESIHPDDSLRLRLGVKTAWNEKRPCDIDYRMKLVDGSERILHHHCEPLLDDENNVISIANTVQNITRQKNAEALIEYQTYFDQLTKLRNRHYFTQCLDKLVHDNPDPNHLVAVVFIGIDRLKAFTDTLGHYAGDHLLKAVSERLTYYLHSKHNLARFSDNTFALLVDNIQHIDELNALAQGLLEVTSETYHVSNNELFITTSIGISLYPIESHTAESLLKGADKALTESKNNGGNQYHFYSSDMNRQAQDRMDLEIGLRKALDSNELAVFYQPQIETVSGKVIGMEALVRWMRPGHGIVSPLDFISVAEETGLIVPIGQWVLETACRQTKQWQDAGFPLRIGVNLSARQFTQEDLATTIDRSLSETGLEPMYLDLEITESTVMHNFNTAVDTLKLLRNKGIKLSIDDFGTGYSSLSYIHRLPIHTLKIDRAFIKDIDANGENGEIARAIIAMAHSMNLSVIAEGVETEDHVKFLQEHECNELQGYFYSKPIPADEFDTFLKKQPA